MAIGTALLVIFGVWLLVAYPRAALRTAAGLVALVVIGVAVVYVWEEIDRPRREREQAAQRMRQQAAEKQVAEEEAWLLRNRLTYHSDDRWLGVSVDRNHCRYFIDLETMALQGYGLNVWIKVERPTLEPGVYLSENCYDYGSPRQVFFSCIAQEVTGAWWFTPGMVKRPALDSSVTLVRQDHRGRERRTRAPAESRSCGGSGARAATEGTRRSSGAFPSSERGSRATLGEPPATLEQLLPGLQVRVRVCGRCKGSTLDE